MKTVADLTYCDRYGSLGRLRPDNARRWGTLTPHG
jgi:hypothetical protein